MSRLVSWCEHALEQLGDRAIALSSAGRGSRGAFLAAFIAATLIGRTIFVMLAGGEDGRWWLPVGVVVIWVVIWLGQHPEPWREAVRQSRVMKLFASRVP